jgi:dTDP-4-amino-4,6-dideoxygalactose transaminase
MSVLTSVASLGANTFPFIKPTVPPITEVLESYLSSYAQGMLTNGGLVARLEATVAERLGVSDCVAVSSCTSGLVLVLKALGVEGEVILPSFTFFATGHAVLWNGLKPVFADCDPLSWTVDPADVEARVTERTGAIMAVHLYGNPARIEELQRIASRHRLRLIFDAAHAFGSSNGGIPIGGFGDVEVFSLSPTKLLTAGEGGLVCTNDATLGRMIRAARNYGDAGDYDPALLGLNARMTEFNAALALAGLVLVERKVQRHNEIAEQYMSLLAGLPGIQFQHVDKDDRSAYKDFSILVSEAECGTSRDEIREALLGEGIPTKRYFYPPLHRQRLFSAKAAKNCPALPDTERISAAVLSLPIYESLPAETVERIALKIRGLVRACV